MLGEHETARKIGWKTALHMSQMRYGHRQYALPKEVSCEKEENKVNVHIPKRGKTYAEKANELRGAKEAELISYGIKIGLRLMADSVNKDHHIANDRLVHSYARALCTWNSEFVGQDAEKAAEDIFQANDRAMGVGWEEKAKTICEKMLKELKEKENKDERNRVR